MSDCLYKRNPLGGFVGQHSKDCAIIAAHLDGEIRVNGHASHHIQYGITKEHPNGAGCLNACGSCAKRFEKRQDCTVSEGAIVAC